MTRKKREVVEPTKAEISLLDIKKKVRFQSKKSIIIGPGALDRLPTIIYDSSKKQRIRKIQARYKKKKWYNVRFKNPGKEYKDFFYMIAQLINLWYHQRILDRITPRELRKSLSIITAINFVMGIICLVIGTTHFIGTKNLLVPQHSPTARSHYAGIAIMGIILTLCASFGFIGIYGKRLWYTKSFAVASFIHGYFLTTVYISWVTQVYFVRTNVFRFQHNITHVDVDRETTRKPTTSEESETLIYNLIYYYMNLILLASISQNISGILALWLLVLHTEKQGYIPMYRRTINLEPND